MAPREERPLAKPKHFRSSESAHEDFYKGQKEKDKAVSEWRIQRAITHLAKIGWSHARAIGVLDLTVIKELGKIICAYQADVASLEDAYDSQQAYIDGLLEQVAALSKELSCVRKAKMSGQSAEAMAGKEKKSEKATKESKKAAKACKKLKKELVAPVVTVEKENDVLQAARENMNAMRLGSKAFFTEQVPEPLQHAINRSVGELVALGDANSMTDFFGELQAKIEEFKEKANGRSPPARSGRLTVPTGVVHSRKDLPDPTATPTTGNNGRASHSANRKPTVAVGDNDDNEDEEEDSIDLTLDDDEDQDAGLFVQPPTKKRKFTYMEIS